MSTEPESTKPTGPIVYTVWTGADVLPSWVTRHMLAIWRYLRIGLAVAVTFFIVGALWCQQ